MTRKPEFPTLAALGQLRRRSRSAGKRQRQDKAPPPILYYLLALSPVPQHKGAVTVLGPYPAPGPRETIASVQRVACVAVDVDRATGAIRAASLMI